MDGQNENVKNLTAEQLETAAGGNNDGTDCFYCQGTQSDGNPCGKSLEQIRGSMYRCRNPLCDRFGACQFPRSGIVRKAGGRE